MGLSLGDLWKRSGDKSYRAKLDKRVQRDAVTLAELLESLVIDDFQFRPNSGKAFWRSV